MMQVRDGRGGRGPGVSPGGGEGPEYGAAQPLLDHPDSDEEPDLEDDKPASSSGREPGASVRTPNPADGETRNSECQVPGCGTPLYEKLKRKVRICDKHRRALVLEMDGYSGRFCQQCSRVHKLECFDGSRRGCRKRLRRRVERMREINGAKNADKDAHPSAAAAEMYARTGMLGREGYAGKDAEDAERAAAKLGYYGPAHELYRDSWWPYGMQSHFSSDGMPSSAELSARYSMMSPSSMEAARQQARSYDYFPSNWQSEWTGASYYPASRGTAEMPPHMGRSPYFRDYPPTTHSLPAHPPHPSPPSSHSSWESTSHPSSAQGPPPSHPGPHMCAGRTCHVCRAFYSYWG